MGGHFCWLRPEVVSVADGQLCLEWPRAASWAPLERWPTWKWAAACLNVRSCCCSGPVWGPFNTNMTRAVIVQGQQILSARQKESSESERGLRATLGPTTESTTVASFHTDAPPLWPAASKCIKMRRKQAERELNQSIPGRADHRQPERQHQLHSEISFQGNVPLASGCRLARVWSRGGGPLQAMM